MGANLMNSDARTNDAFLKRGYAILTTIAATVPMK